MNAKKRLLGAIADLQRHVIHHPDEAKCPVCPRWDELQQAALALVRAHDRDGERYRWAKANLYKFHQITGGAHSDIRESAIDARVDAAMRAEG